MRADRYLACLTALSPGAAWFRVISTGLEIERLAEDLGLVNKKPEGMKVCLSHTCVCMRVSAT